MATPDQWRRQGNLPAELTGFVGRTRLLATIRQRLRDHRLVTVTGIAGVGKTRTVVRLAHSVGHMYPDGVWFADLSRLHDPLMLQHAVATALGLSGSVPLDGDGLVQWLSGRKMLLILDTCEHLVEPCAQLAQDLLESCERLTMLLTSRQPLGLPGEQTVPVQPMALPGDDPNEPALANESVRLFAERAAEVLPGFVVDDDSVDRVAELCRRLDGIPLAIELAAVRIRSLSVEQILDLLADRFRLLTSGAGQTAQARHRTLYTAIGWSHELCSPAERLLWARLSVFSGDFDLPAAQYVCAVGSIDADDITDLLRDLVDKSIVLCQSDRYGVRYRLVDALREYGTYWSDRLEETGQMRDRHLAYYLSLAKEGELAWSGRWQLEWFQRLRQEHDNIRAAIAYCQEDPERSRDGLRLLSSLWYLWAACGFTREGKLYIERALDSAPEPSPERCKALWVLSYLRSMHGDASGAAELAERCSAEAQLVGDPSAAILGIKMQGTAAFLQGDLNKAAALLGVAIDMYEGPRSRQLNPGLLPAIVEQALILTAQQEFKQAEDVLAETREFCRERGELWLRSYATWAMSLTQRAAAQTAKAIGNALEALEIKYGFHDMVGCVLVLETLAALAVDEGRADDAACLLGTIQANWRLLGLPQFGSPFFTQEHERCVKECRSALGEEAYVSAYDRGARLSFDESVMFATGRLPG